MLRSLLTVSAVALSIQVCVLVVMCACGCCFACVGSCINAVKPILHVPGLIDLLPDLYFSSVMLAAATTIEPVDDTVDGTAASLTAPVVVISAIAYFFQLSDRATVFRDLVRVGCSLALAAYWAPAFAPAEIQTAIIVAAVLYSLYGLCSYRHTDDG